MNGHAERTNGLSRKLVKELVVGREYLSTEVSVMLGWKPKAVSMAGGVSTPNGADAQVLWITLNKPESFPKPYKDHIFGTTLFWTAQQGKQNAENNLIKDLRDTFVFIQEYAKTPYYYFGRAIDIRMQLSSEYNVPSHVIFDLPEYDFYCKDNCINPVGLNPFAYFEHNQNYVSPRYRNYNVRFDSSEYVAALSNQSDYRNESIKLWDGKCAVTGMDNISWLTLNHVKPIRESFDYEKRDPNNSILLIPSYGKLFRRGDISFDAGSGNILIPSDSDSSAINNLQKMHIDDNARINIVNDSVAEYLDYHNRYIFQFKQMEDQCNSSLMDKVIDMSFL